MYGLHVDDSLLARMTAKSSTIECLATLSIFKLINNKLDYLDVRIFGVHAECNIDHGP